MHVTLKKMWFWSRVSILLTVALVLANAQCFAQCLAQPDDSTRSHCHQHGPAKAGHCVQQHDLRAGAAGLVAPDCGLVALVELADLPMLQALAYRVELSAPSPPLSGTTTPLLLRV
jgi:hypothetical protein